MTSMEPGHMRLQPEKRKARREVDSGDTSR